MSLIQVDSCSSLCSADRANYAKALNWAGLSKSRLGMAKQLGPPPGLNMKAEVLQTRDAKTRHKNGNNLIGPLPPAPPNSAPPGGAPSSCQGEVKD
ncbi:hypothetical protein MHYP_G00318160 [Metynnis hypsauchen]